MVSWNEYRGRNLAAARAQARLGRLGLSAGSLVLTGISALFHIASSMPWLTPTEAHLQPISRCDAIALNRHRQICVEAVIAATLARGTPFRVASTLEPPARAAVANGTRSATN